MIEPICICLIAERLSAGDLAGSWGFLIPITRKLQQRGHHVTVLTWKGHLQEEHLEVHVLGENPKYAPLGFAQALERKFNELNESNPFDVVHSLTWKSLPIGSKRKKNKIAMIYDIEATQMGHVFSALGQSQDTVWGLLTTGVIAVNRFLSTYWSRDRKLLRSADGIFVQSPQQRWALERYYYYPDSKVFSVPLSLEISDLSPREKSSELMAKLGLEPDTPLIVAVSDMEEAHEMKHILYAFESVVIKKPHAHMIVIGNGPKFKDIEYIMLQLALGNRVHFVGNLSEMEMANHVALADLVINIGARRSGYDPTILEAMAQKKVVVASEFSAVAALIEDGVDGFLVRPADFTTLSGLMFYSLNGTLNSVSLGEKARNKVIELFNVDKIVDRTESAYAKILKRSKSWFFR